MNLVFHNFLEWEHDDKYYLSFYINFTTYVLLLRFDVGSFIVIRDTLIMYI